MKTEFAGTVTIAWDAVTGVKSDGPLLVDEGLAAPWWSGGHSTAADFAVKRRRPGYGQCCQGFGTSIRNKRTDRIRDGGENGCAQSRLIDLWIGFLDLGYATSRRPMPTQDNSR